jgi:hypothetical protein
MKGNFQNEGEANKLRRFFSGLWLSLSENIPIQSLRDGEGS